MTQDTITEQENLDQNCDPASATFESCDATDHQAWWTSQNDWDAAQSQLKQDFETFSAAASTYATALSTFIGEINALQWAQKYSDAVIAVVTTAQAYSTDVNNEAAETPDTPQVTINELHAQSAAGVTNFNNACSTLWAEILPPGAAKL